MCYKLHYKWCIQLIAYSLFLVSKPAFSQNDSQAIDLYNQERYARGRIYKTDKGQ